MDAKQLQAQFYKETRVRVFVSGDKDSWEERTVLAYVDWLEKYFQHSANERFDRAQDYLSQTTGLNAFVNESVMALMIASGKK